MSGRVNGEANFGREQAWQLLTEWTQGESLRKHALAVEICVTACGEAEADRLGLSGDERAKFIQLYTTTGLLHDFDYDQFPTREEHPYTGEKILEERGYPADIRRAIMSHAEYTGVTRETTMEKALFACDELSGFLTACALVKPNRSIFEVEAASVKKKMKDKAFARSVNRDDITSGAADLGVDLLEHIGFCIHAMQGAAEELGLKGTG